MGSLSWITEHWFDLLQTGGIIASLLFTTRAMHSDTKMRRLSNLLDIADSHRDIWSELYERPTLFRILEKDVDLTKHPISAEERLFVKTLILHLDTVRRAMKVEMFVKLEGLQKDVKAFFSLPIPASVWENIKHFQDRNFVTFIDGVRNGR